MTPVDRQVVREELETVNDDQLTVSSGSVAYANG
jgi:hypothetical protein